ncbi:methyltransferase [Mucilaginibacter sp. 21P]|uniref:tRNA1(Val) (adenine(37)-N6)-methyltransferase n=1 Tax=Mucilaginibacter sp. 21P TaxID=2778902 RepID=UPI001C56B074|nr:methyltransferase [Mucilaginibacter sp. 21P]QXV64613.1 methyltransferase [Mucilaginibacter sp. 21P]
MSFFKFKQFDVDQTGCAMKVNTDGVLLAALAKGHDAKTILDVGAGTGVVALMLAQRFPQTYIDAVEIDDHAADTATKNFTNSKFAERLRLFKGDFANLERMEYDLIISNPPFFIDSLRSVKDNKALARHTDSSFFERLVSFAAENLSAEGICQLILPVATSELVIGMLAANSLYLQSVINIRSFATDDPHREVITFGKDNVTNEVTEVVIYESPKVYTTQYSSLLKDFLTIF